MKIEYIIISKKEDDKLIPPSESFFKDLFLDVTNNSFIFKANENESGKKVSYKEKFSHEKELCYLQVEYEEEDPIESAKTLMLTCDKIESGSHRAKYYFIRTKDEACEKYSEKIYPIIGKFEKKLRELVYHVVLKAYGKKWTNQTNLKQDIESGLEELTLTQLYDFLFEKTIDKNVNDYWEEDLNPDLIKSKKQDELIDLIESFRPNSLWDKLFVDVKIEGIKNKDSLDEIKKIRDAVAHNRIIKIKKCNDVEKIIKSLLPELEKNIDMVKQKTFTFTEQEIISQQLEALLRDIKITIEKLEEEHIQMIKQKNKNEQFIIPP